MKSMSDKETAILLIRKSGKQVLACQDECRKILENLNELGNEDYRSDAVNFSFSALMDRMKNEHWVPTWKDRQEILGEEYIKSPVEKSILEIEDKDLRFAVYGLVPVNEHLQRMHAYATFFSFFNAKPDSENAICIFNLWCRSNMYFALSKEMDADGNNEIAVKLRKKAEFFETILSILLDVTD